nr:hypothetical protein [Tanacetum cinerariifolium]
MCINFTHGSDSKQRTNEFIHVYLAFASVYVWIGIKTTDEGTQILATVDGKSRTISESSIRRNLKLNDEEGMSSLPDAELFENLALMGKARIAQSIALPTAVNEPASLSRDDSQGEAFPSISGLEAGQDRENIIKTSAFTHDSTPWVTSFAADEEMVNVLTSMDAANILTSEVQAISVPFVTEIPTIGVPTGSGMVPTVSAIFTTASVVTLYSRRKGKEKMVESNTPKKKKLQEHIDVQVAREMEEQMAREDQRRNEQIAKGLEIARIHAEEELKMMINGLDRSNEVITRHLYEYEQSQAELTIGEKIELINELMKYQDHHAEILKYQAQQSKPLSKKQQREFYMSLLKSHSGWKTKHFKGMTLEEIREKFIPIWKQIKDFVPMASKEEGERVKRKWLKLEQESAKKMKTTEEVSEEDLKEMMQLVPVEELWSLVKETRSIRQASSDKEKELWVELKRLFEPDFKEQLWTHTQALMHDPLEWKLYNSCGVHHVLTRDQEIFMLVERDYPLRKGLAIVMISNKLQVVDPYLGNNNVQVTCDDNTHQRIHSSTPLDISSLLMLQQK